MFIFSRCPVRNPGGFEKQKAIKSHFTLSSHFSSDTIHIYATLAFIVVIIVIGVPMWWKTTEVYRVSLPYAEIESLDDTPIKATIRMGLFVGSSRERRDILAFELRKKFENNCECLFDLLM